MKILGIKIIALLVFCTIIPLNIIAQKKFVDSSFLEITKLKEDTSKVIAFLNLAKILIFKDSTIIDSRNAADSAYFLSKKINYTKGIIEYWLLNGKISRKQSRFADAIEYLNMALKYSKKINNKTYEAFILNEIAVTYRWSDNYKKAVEYHLQALEVSEKIKSQKIKLYTINGLGNCYIYLRDYKKAMDYFNHALLLADSLDEKKSLAINYNNIGEVYELTKDYKNSIIYYKKSLKINLELNDLKGISISNSSLGSLLYIQNDFLKALDFYKQSLTLEQQLGDKIYIAKAYINVGKTYSKLLNFSQAEEYIQKGLEIAINGNSRSNISDGYLMLSELYAKQKKYKESYEFMHKYSIAKDSLINFEITNTTAKIQAIYDLDKAQDKLNYMKKENELQTLKNLQFQILLFTFFLSAIFIIVGLFLFRQSVIRKRSNKNLEEKNNEIKEANTRLVEEIEIRKFAEQVQKDLLSEKDSLISEIHHRVKNNLAIINGLIHLQMQTVNNSETKEILNETKNRIYSIALIHEHLYSNVKKARIDVTDYLIKQIDVIKTNFKDKNIDVMLNSKDISLGLHQAVPVGLIINELLTNSFLHAFPDRETGRITLNIFEENNLLVLEMKDNGIGLPTGFSIEKAKSPGLLIVSIFIQQLKANAIIENNEGAYFKLIFKPTEMKVWN